MVFVVQFWFQAGKEISLNSEKYVKQCDNGDKEPFGHNSNNNDIFTSELVFPFNVLIFSSLLYINPINAARNLIPE